MIEKYRYLRDENGHARITICLMMDGESGRVGKGVAICSPRDFPCKNTGRKIARDRAIAAIYNKTRDGLPIQRDEAVITVHDCTDINDIFCLRRIRKALRVLTGVHASYFESATTPIWVDFMWIFLSVLLFMDHAPALWGKLFS